MKTQLLKKLSLLLCVCLLLPLFGCANGNTSTGQQAAEDKTIQPPFAGVKWGMTVEQVQAALGDRYKLEESDGVYTVADYQEDIFGAAIGTSAAYMAYTGTTKVNSLVNFSFTQPITCNGETVPGVLTEITFLLCSDDSQKILDTAAAYYGLPVIVLNSEFAAGDEMPHKSYCINDQRQSDKEVPTVSELSLAMYLAQSRSTSQAKIDASVYSGQIDVQSMLSDWMDDSEKSLYPQAVFTDYYEKKSDGTYIAKTMQINLRAGVTVYDDIAAQYAGK